MGKSDAARKYFKRLIVERPQSRFVPNAFLSFGDYFFGQGDFENALKFYDKVLAFPGSNVADYARYKSGWCWFNQSDYKQSLAQLTQVAMNGHDDKIVREARRDLVRVYALVGDRAKARDFFARVAPANEVERMLSQLDEAIANP